MRATATTSSSTALTSSSCTDRRTLALSSSNTMSMVRLSRPAPHTAFHLRNAGLVLEMLSEGFLTLSFDCVDHLPQLAALAKRYADRQPDLADLCLIRMSELYPHHRVITA